MTGPVRTARGAAVLAVRIVIAILTLAAAAPVAAQPGDTGFIGKGAAQLEIDDCPPPDPAATEAQLTARFDALYDRGEVLYLQGDYPGAVREFISGYCIAGGFAAGRKVRYALLKDIGQAYERNLDYEKAIAYFERFVGDYPAGVDPADRRVVESRVTVLQKLRAHVFVETSPGGANVTISNDSGVAGLGRSGKEIEVPGGTYTMLVELPGHEPHTQQIEVRIGKPFAFFVPMRPLRGRLSVQVAPPDAKVFLRDRSVERFVGVGRVDEVLPTGKYVLVADASDRLSVERPIEVLPNRVNRMQIDLPLKPQFGRRQLIAFSAIGAAYSSAGLLFVFREPALSGLGLAVGAGVGLFGSYALLPDQVTLGTSSLTITSAIAGTIAGIAATRLFTSDEGYILPIQGATTLLGAGLGYYAGNRTRITPGDAALITSSMAWGTAMGGLFAASFGGEDGRISAGLILSGFGMGSVSGVLMARYFDVSRRRTILVDIGGLIGMIGGLAAAGLAYPTEEEGSDVANEHRANFVLGGVAVGLLGAGFLTRNIDAPRIPVKPAIGTTAAAGGPSTAIYGISGVW
jgi:tetratricopeptide (TPR) repeat protein